MTQFIQVGLQSTAGSPPAPPVVTGGPTCTECGGCTFSDVSYLAVETHSFSCTPGLTDTETNGNWPYHSATASRVRYELDASNWAEYDCTLRRWTYSATTTEVGGACVLSTGAPVQIDFCNGFQVYRPVNSDSTLIIKATLKQNNCIPSVAA